MKPLLLIATDEWRYWLRSHLALGGVAIFLLLYVITSVLVSQNMRELSAKRTHHQQHAEQTFSAQPDKQYFLAPLSGLHRPQPR